MADLGSIEKGATLPLVDDTFSSATSIEHEFVIESDTLMLSAFIRTTDGNVDIKAEALTNDGTVTIIEFPTVTATTQDVLLRKASLATTRIRVTVTTSAGASLVVHARAIDGADTTVSLSGMEGATSYSKEVSDAEPTEVVAGALGSRSGLVVKNYTLNAVAFIGFTSGEASEAQGYPLEYGESMGIDLAAGTSVWALSDGGAIDMRIIEGGT